MNRLALKRLFKALRNRRDKRLVEKELKERNEEIKEMSQFIGESIPKLRFSACFHGEIWYRCPHCNKGIEAHGIEETEDHIHKCYYCGEKFYYTRFEK